MSDIRASKPFYKHTYDSVQYGFVFSSLLPAGVTIATVDATTVATEAGTSSTALTCTGGAANGSTFTDDDGNTVAIGEAVQATVAGGTAGVRYGITVKVTASNGEKYGGIFSVIVKG